MDTEIPKDVNLQSLCDVVVQTLRRVYGINSQRHDPLLGDDAVTFGINIYRNSWYSIELETDDLDGWTTARPDGSLVLTGPHHRVHVYRFGSDENVDLDRFRLDEVRTSATKRLIAESNAVQLELDLGGEAAPRQTATESTRLTEQVVVHAGNPDDGCCGIWIGAPVPTEEITTSPWASLSTLWRIERAAADAPSSRTDDVTPHREMTEPEVTVEPRVDEEDAENEG